MTTAYDRSQQLGFPWGTGQVTARFDTRLLICSRVADPEGQNLLGQLQLKCVECGQMVWVSTSSWPFLHDDPEIQVTCSECGIRRMKQEEVAVLSPTAGQISEFLSSLGIVSSCDGGEYGR